MTCYYPVRATRSAIANPSGKRSLIFNSKNALIEGTWITLPCSRCIGCRLDKARQWSIRCSHESKTTDPKKGSCWLTLTYDDEHLPVNNSVDVRVLQKFMRKLRKHAGCRVRFLGVGEYGDNKGRAHYHIVIYGYDFPDKKHFATRKGHRVYNSETLKRLWPYGFHEIGDVTPSSAGYTARYTLKKITGPKATDHYWRQSPIDGQHYRVKPEFATMSRRPGLGSEWFDKFGADAFPMTKVVQADGNVVFRPADDFIIVDGRKVRPPQYYLRKLSEDDQKKITRKRKLAAAQPAAKADSTKERLAVREFVKKERIKGLVRSL